MLRQCYTRPLHWADKTMSVMRADLLEACEKDLAGFPAHCLFDPACSDLDAEALYEFSFFAEEDRHASKRKPRPSLHTVEQLRNRVLQRFIQEVALLSVDEHDLLIRVALFGGTTPLTDWNELLPARGLTRRLWCRVESRGDNMLLIMPHQLCSSALLLLAGDKHREVREKVEQVHESIEDTLYLLGAAQAAGPARHLASLLKGTFAEGVPELIDRFLLTGYDYVYDRGGNLLLIHPGLAEPEKMTHLPERNDEALLTYHYLGHVPLTEASQKLKRSRAWGFKRINVALCNLDKLLTDFKEEDIPVS